MRIRRRELLRLAGGAAAWLAGTPRPARALTTAREIHLETRNTLLGSIGVRGRTLAVRPAATFKAYRGIPPNDLPPVRPARAVAGSPLAATLRTYTSTRAFGGAALPLEEVARLLHLANGVTGRAGQLTQGLALRAAPSAGTLYPGELYLVAEHVDGLEPGVYYYSPVHNWLVPLKHGPSLDVVASSVEDPRAVAGAAAAVLITNVFARSRVRYANRGYRYALVDTGHIDENLRLAATAGGHGEVTLLRFQDDRLNELLGVDGRGEAVCAVHALGRACEAEAGPAPAASPLAELGEMAAEQIADLADVVERYHATSKLVPSDGPRRSPPSVAPAADAEEPDHPLPASNPVEILSLEAAIRERRSSRQIEVAPIAANELAYLLEMAHGNARAERAPGVELRAAVNRVQGIEPGLYRYVRERPGLVLVRRGDLSTRLQRACLGQSKAARAAVVLLMVADLEAGVARNGQRSYRDMLIEAGAIGQRIYLAAEAIGLTARNLAAFVDDRLNALARLDGRARVVVHLTVVAHGD